MRLAPARRRFATWRNFTGESRGQQDSFREQFLAPQAARECCGLFGGVFGVCCSLVLEGRRIAPGASPGRKVRTPLGATLRNPGLFGWDTRRRKVERLFDGQCHRKLNRRRRKLLVRVKRCGKSAPREAQATRHGKPRRVQGQIGNRGAARSASAKAAGFGYRSLRQMILSAARRRQNSAYSPAKTTSSFRPEAEG